MSPADASPVRTDGWVQPILVSKTGDHLSTIAAAARASVLAYLLDPANPAWAQWLDGPFTKTVRRTTSAKIDVAAAADSNLARVEQTQRDEQAALALAFPPSRYSDLPREVARAQVSGTDLPRRTVTGRQRGPFAVLVDASLTTGKAAAQASHAAWMWMLARNTSDPELVAEWARSGAPFEVLVVSAGQLQALELSGADRAGFHFVHDAGWTEVAPRTLTAVALPA